MNPVLRSLVSTLSVTLPLSCAGGASDPAPAQAPTGAPQTPSCESAGGMCLPNTNSAPPTYRQATMEEGVCARRDEICWLRQ